MNSFEKDWKKLEKVIRQRQGKESGIKNFVVACEPPILVLDRCSDYKQCRFNLTVARYATAAAALCAYDDETPGIGEIRL